MIFYEAHTALLKRLADPLGETAYVLKLGMAGPNYLARQQRPNYYDDGWSLDARCKLSDFIAGDFSNDGGVPDQTVRDLVGYVRSTFTGGQARKNQYGAVFTSNWKSWTNRVTWAAHGDWKPDDWDATYPTTPFVPPWPLLNVYPPEVYHNFPWVEPSVFSGWFDDYSNPTPAGPQNPWTVASPNAASLALSGLASFPIGLTYLTIKRGEDDEVALCCTFANGATWWRPGGTLFIRSGCAFTGGSSDYLYRVLGSLFDDSITMPWTGDHYAVPITSRPDASWKKGLTLADLTSAFPDSQVVTWGFTEYVDDDPGPEVLPKMTGTVSDPWTNETLEPVTVSSVAVVMWNADTSAWDVILWGELEDAVEVGPGEDFELLGLDYTVEEQE